jgi:cytidyltransferase-like protein
MASTGLATVSILSLPDRPDVTGTILHAMGEQNINIEFIVLTADIEGSGNMTFCIDQKYLEEAKQAGGKNAKLVVIVARDSTAENRKGRRTVMPEDQRRALVESLKVVDEAILGYENLTWATLLKP